VDSLPLQVLLDLNSLSSDRLLAVCFPSHCELPLHDPLGVNLAHFVDDLADGELYRFL